MIQYNFVTAHGCDWQWHQVNAELEIRGDAEVCLRWTDMAHVVHAPVSAKQQPVFTTSARYVTGPTARYEQEDIDNRIFEHVLHKYESLQFMIPGNVKEQDDLYLWKSDAKLKKI
jgi:hypothetical protein